MAGISYVICQRFRVALIALAAAAFGLPGMAQNDDLADQVQEMYIAYYGRPGDPGGLDFWAQQLVDSGGNLNAIIDAFGNSQEYNDRYGELGNEALVDNIYQQLLSRSADPGGLAFYVERLESGALTLASIALDIANGVQGGEDASILENKLTVANAFTHWVRNSNAAYDADNIDEVKAMMDSVDTSSASVDSALDAVTEILDITQGGCLENSLSPGNTWSFAWNSSIETFAQPDSTSSETDYGQFTVTVGSPRAIDDQTAYSLTVTGDVGEFSPRWQYLSVAPDGSLLGSSDGNNLETVYSAVTSNWVGGGFFAEFSAADAVIVSSGTFDGEYNQVSSNIARTSSSDGGCERILDFTLCSDSSTSFSEKEYFKECVGPIGYQVLISYSDEGGGFFTSTQIERTVELTATTFEPDDGTTFNPPPWEEVASMPFARSSHQAVVLGGEIYVLDGYDGNNFVTTVHIYNPDSDSWRTGPSLPSAGGYSAEVVDNVIYVSGFSNVYYYEVGASSWVTVPVTVGDGDFGSSATYTDAFFGNTIVGLTGGSSVDQAWDVVGYQPLENLWLEGVGLIVGEWLRPSVEVVGDTLYAIGGFGDGAERGALNKVATYSLSGDVWTSSAASTMNVSRDGLATTVLHGQIFAFGGNPVNCGLGGSCNVGAPFRSAEFLNPETGIWMEIQPMFNARTNFAAVELNGSLYVIGGDSGSGERLSSVERYQSAVAN